MTNFRLLDKQVVNGLRKIAWASVCSAYKYKFKYKYIHTHKHTYTHPHTPKLGIGIEETNTGIGTPAYMISVWYQNKKMPDSISLVQYRTGSGAISFFHFGTALTGCWTVRHSGILKFEP